MSGRIGSPKELPKGFVLYNRPGEKGLFLQNLSDTQGHLVPNTRMDLPIHICILSELGWVFYIDSRLGKLRYLRPDGSGKGTVPLSRDKGEKILISGVLRNSPFGHEILYAPDSVTVKAIRLDLEDEGLVFSDQRTLLDLRGSPMHLRLSGDDAVIGSGNQLVTKLFGETDLGTVAITSFVSIPESGKGTATFRNVQQWTDSPPWSSSTCGFSMSADGKRILMNPGGTINSEYKSCIPRGHKGFALLPFVSNTYPIPYQDIYEDSAISINWCPPEYREGVPPFMNDFYRWDFGNSNTYVAGRISGSQGGFHSIWIVNWENNTWTPLTSAHSPTLADHLALHIGQSVSPDSFVPEHSAEGEEVEEPIDMVNPNFQVVAPNGGEVFRIGDTCKIIVGSARDGDALLLLQLGESTYMFPELEGSFNPRNDSVFIWVIPDSIQSVSMGKPVSHSLVHNRCRFALVDYAGNPEYIDFSDEFFAILPRDP